MASEIPFTPLESLVPQELLALPLEALSKGESIVVEELWNTPKAIFATAAQQAVKKHVLILTAASKEEGRLYQDLLAFSKVPVVDFPAWETLPNENVAPSPDIVGERYNVLQKLVSSSEPQIVVGSLQSCLQRLMSPQNFTSLYLSLAVGEEKPFNEVIDRFLKMGYKRLPQASDKGEFAVRGGLIDIFPVNQPEPIRIEFWGDEITTIRAFDPVSQRSIRSIEKISITPAQELEFVTEEKHPTTILDYLGDNVLLILDDLLALEDRYAALTKMLSKSTPTFSDIFSFMAKASKYQTLFFLQQPLEELQELALEGQKRKGYYSVNAPLTAVPLKFFGLEFSAMRWRSPFIPLGDYFFPDNEEGTLINGWELLKKSFITLGTEAHFQIVSSAESEEAALQRRMDEWAISLPKKCIFHKSYISSGFALNDPPQVVISMAEINGRYKLRRQKLRSTYHVPAADRFELNENDIVVHINNGVGRYLGIEFKKDLLGNEKEFLAIEYAESSKLFVPVEQSYLVSKYIGASTETPKFHTLGAGKWKMVREKTEKAITGYAQDLLEMYAKREMGQGFCYPKDSAEMIVFEEEFPFVETEDQLAAIAAIKNDMAGSKAMDRLVCGDVGYGKTEVAMRAAFKAVVDGHKQVAVLVPTTVLAAQHYESFCERMANFAVNIDVISRYRSAKQVKETVKKAAEGGVDILIGTHRLLSEDVVFKDLGLIIIDEEQRFGVKAKEHLKKIKANVDCLTLSATPIPRTLYMSLIGVRDMSAINTPPQDRLPIKTILAEPGDEIIRNALMRELSRDGQAFVIHNRVETIDEYAYYLQRLLPQARIAVAHGQMSGSMADEIFHAYKSGRIDILVATTIIENGVDMPNANTILIDRADRFGMADLYQMRGRVGRWNRRAYAYFFVPRMGRLPELSRKRLEAMAASSGYGGGMKVALCDLELRGAGELLGEEQSGHVAAVGFHLYCKLLKRKIAALQGKESVVVDTKMEIAVDARLPNEYVEDVSLRMDIYQRLGEANSVEEIEFIWSELQDRFGKAPLPAEWLYHLARIRIKAGKQGIALIKQEKVSLLIEGKKEGNPFSKRVFIKWSSNAPALYEKALLSAL